MAKFSQGVFTPKNVQKYLGTKQPRYRSGWELAFMRMCDAHPNITGWASEAIKIPYIHPITGRRTHTYLILLYSMPINVVKIILK